MKGTLKGCAMTESEALKRFIPILGRISPPGERATITRNILDRIAGKQTSVMGISHKHAGALAWPNDTTKAIVFEKALNAAVDAGEFVSFLHSADRRHFQIEELCAWPDCPKVDTDSPLIFWLGDGFTEAVDTAPVTDTTPAETKEQRQDRRLQACINAGLVMPKNSFGRLPKGVDKVAELEGVTRQAFSSEVKAALERMQRLASAKSEGVTVRRI